ncbi:MAG: acetyltransferase [Candidatus Hinthialibacter antarcticus]|nr:acetyltransferase [Candidatus Hinthialibacter antarcticus]
MSNAQKGILIYGAGGHGKVLIELLQSIGIEVAAIIDDRVTGSAERLLGVAVISPRDAIENYIQPESMNGLVAIGDNVIRLEKAAWFESRGVEMVVVIHPSAVVSASAKIGRGTQVIAGAVINAEAQLGANCIVNTNSVVEHDCVIGDGVHIAPGALVGGGASIGDRSQISIGASVLPGIKIGSDVMVGAGAVVTKPVADGVTVVGVPARILQK